jgi:iron complex outermembrane receptor protein
MLVTGLLGAAAVHAADADTTLETITVTATRIARPAFDVPASIDSREPRRDTLGVNLAESLTGIPGLVARDRQNYAQDTQISIRGFGARSTFGIRGVRLYVDGIPATQPDGQGQVSHFNMGTAGRIEVLRGPFSALYGNSSGGVIQLYTADGVGSPNLSAGVASADYGTTRAEVGSAGAFDAGSFGALNYRAGYAHFSTDGSRGHSAATRDSLQGKWALQGEKSRLTLSANYFDAPDAQDPLGLTRAQYDADPTQSAPASIQFNTRKSALQRQIGAIYEWSVSDTQSIRVMGYGGDRAIQQFLALPISSQTDARNSGGVVDLATNFSGGELRWNTAWQFGAQRLTLVVGADYDGLSQVRRGYENFIGTTLGVIGALRRDETDKVHDFDQFLQLEWAMGAHWSALAGVRHSELQFSAADRYIRSGNPDDSGQVDYGATSPVASLMWHAMPALNLYASLGQGFETPTLAELAYRSDALPGLNFSLGAARTSNTELGAKLRLGAGLQVDAALFRAMTRNELVVATNLGGRSSYVNAGRTWRQGVELSLSAQLSALWRWQLAYTALQATVRDTYLTCTAAPCSRPTTAVVAGSRLPGVPAGSVYQQLVWGRDTGWRATLEARYVSGVYADDANSARAAGYASVDLGAGYARQLSGARLRGYVRIDNLLDRRYIGSVIVNEGNSRYFEPAAGRTLLVGVNAVLGSSRDQ